MCSTRACVSCSAVVSCLGNAPIRSRACPPPGYHSTHQPFLPSFRPREASLTQADRRLACPAAVSFAGTVFGATPEGEALLARVDECVTHGWQVQCPDVGMCGRLWLLAVVGWVRAKTTLGSRNPGFESSAPFSYVEACSFPSLPFHAWAPPPSSLCRLTLQVSRNVLA